MLRILVVDDEAPIRQWFSYCIEKNRNEYEIIGTAANGSEALQIYKLMKPNVIITDIKMPVMDGIELINQIRVHDSEVRIIILTCMAEFDYARQAMKLGASDYLLKTEVNDETIIHLLDGLNLEFNKKPIDANTQNNIIQSQRDAFIKKLFETNPVPGITSTELEKLGIQISELNLFCLALKNCESINKIKEEEIVGKLLESFYTFNYYDNVILLIGSLKGVPSQLIQMNNLLLIARQAFKTCGNSVGVSNIYQGVNSLKQIIQEALQSLSREFFSEVKNVFLFNDKIDKENQRVIYTKLCSKIETINIDDIEVFEKDINEFFSYVLKDLVQVDFIYAVCIKLYESILRRTKMENSEIDESLEVIHEIKQFKYFKDVKDWTVSKCTNIVNHYINENKYSVIIRKVIQFVKQNYSKGINLEDAARHVHLNPDYLSRVFKSETGNNFTSYITSIRMEKAKELTETTDLKINQIALQVGYSNISHFSRVYRKYTGKNASDDRSK